MPPNFKPTRDLPRFAWQVLVVVVIYQMCFYLNDLYDVPPTERREDQAIRLGQSLGAASLLLGLLYYLVPSLLVGRGVFFLNAVLACGFILLSRVALDGCGWPRLPRTSSFWVRRPGFYRGAPDRRPSRSKAQSGGIRSG